MCRQARVWIWRPLLVESVESDTSYMFSQNKELIGIAEQSHVTLKYAYYICGLSSMHHLLWIMLWNHSFCCYQAWVFSSNFSYRLDVSFLSTILSANVTNVKLPSTTLLFPSSIPQLWSPGAWVPCSIGIKSFVNGWTKSKAKFDASSRFGECIAVFGAILASSCCITARCAYSKLRALLIHAAR